MSCRHAPYVCVAVLSLSCDALASQTDPPPRQKHGTANPAAPADIVGRDLALPASLRQMGHVALSSSAGKVIEALPERPAIQINTLDNFKARTRYWGATYYAGQGGMSVIAQFAAVQRALQIMQIGARYTLSPLMTRAKPPQCKGCTARRGMYRCDTFVKDALQAGGVPYLTYSTFDTPLSLWRDHRFALRN